MAQRDPLVWENGDKFVIRSMAEYHTKFCGFADFANSPNLGSANSHSCPGKDLAFAMITSFVTEFVRTAERVEGGHKQIWVCDRPPSDINISAFAAGGFELTYDVTQLVTEEDQR